MEATGIKTRHALIERKRRAFFKKSTSLYWSVSTVHYTYIYM